MKLYLICFALLFVLLLEMPACVSKEKGCTDVTALNYNPNALSDNGDCLYALPLPDVYRFKRGNVSSVAYEAQVALNLLIEALVGTIAQLAQPGAQSITLSNLTDIYQQTGLEQPILNTTNPYVPSATNCAQIAGGQRLSGNVVNTFKADSLLLSWFDTIAVRSQNVQYLGTPDVYTTSDGFNLLAATQATLLSSVACANALSLLKNISGNANNLLATNNNYTPMENAWDKAWGFFGAATAYPLYTDEVWASTNYQDDNLNDTLDFTTEYNFTFATNAAQRDLINDGNTNYTQQLFEAWVKGRTAITNKTDILRTEARLQLLTGWEGVTAATAIHYLNGLEYEMQNYGTPDENIAALNLNWTYLWAYLMNLRYFTTPQANVPDLLLLLGSKPVYAVPNSDAYNAYIEKLNQIAQELKTAYTFTDFQVQNW